MTAQTLKAPFPWFGGKSRAASLIWERFGDPEHYIEPFAGSLAVLLARPSTPRIETVNDKDCYLANFWRAVQAAPEEVARWADWPVNEADLHARDRWLQAQSEFRERMQRDPDYYDAKIAGWWVWGVSTAIGNAGAFCNLAQPTRYLGAPPNMRHHGGGIHALTFDFSIFAALSDRLRRVRVLCGDWTRCLSNTPLRAGGGVTAVLLDPPYSEGDYAYAGNRRGEIGHLSARVREWALAHGDDPRLRIALCGYEGEHEMPSDWECVSWRANGGYGNLGIAPNENRHRERIWFSPGCLSGRQASLFGEVQP